MTCTTNSYLTFRLGDELFAANVNQVIEILELPRITKVPRSPDFVRGVINLRGNVLSVVDSRIKFGLPQVEDTINTCIIVMIVNIDGQSMTIGLIVDAVKEVTEIETARIQGLPEIGSKYKAEFIDGMVKSGNEFIMLLNIDYVLSTLDVTLLAEVKASTEKETA